jgi:hypothetical protein
MGVLGINLLLLYYGMGLLVPIPPGNGSTLVGGYSIRWVLLGFVPEGNWCSQLLIHITQVFPKVDSQVELAEPKSGTTCSLPRKQPV